MAKRTTKRKMVSGLRMDHSGTIWMFAEVPIERRLNWKKLPTADAIRRELVAELQRKEDG